MGLRTIQLFSLTYIPYSFSLPHTHTHTHTQVYIYKHTYTLTHQPHLYLNSVKPKSKDFFVSVALDNHMFVFLLKPLLKFDVIFVLKRRSKLKILVNHFCDNLVNCKKFFNIILICPLINYVYLKKSVPFSSSLKTQAC